MNIIKMENLAQLKMKVALGNEIRMFLPTGSFETFNTKIHDIFKEKLVVDYKVYYVDQENDVILVTTQEDFEAALAQAKGSIKFYIGSSSESIRESFIKTESLIPSKKSETSFEVINNTDLKPESHSVEEEKSIIEPKQEIVEKFAEQIKLMIKQELLKIPEAEIETKINSLMVNSSMINLGNSTVMDPKASCNICKITPIKEVVYKCLTCPEYYLCSKCEEKYSHEHPLLKQRTSAKVDTVPLEEYTDIYKAEYFDDNSCKIYKVVAGQDLTLYWMVKNIGTKDWPLDTIFAQTSGPLDVKPLHVGSLKAGSFKKITTKIKADKTPGNYVGNFQLVCNGYSKFGPRVKATVVVEKLKESEKVAKELKNMILVSKMGVPKYMEQNIMRLLEICEDTEPKVLFEMLKKSKNSVEEVANEIFSKSAINK